MSEKSIEPVKQAKELIQAQGFSLAPQNLGELMTFANMLANSELVPKDYKGKPGNVLVALQMGSEIGIQPMQAIQNIAVINGKPSIYGDLGKALLRSRGCDIEEEDVEKIKKTGIAWCVISRQGQKPVKRTFTLEDAKTAKLWGKEGPWSTYPFRQMSWRAFWFAARDAAPDILKGIIGKEEVEDYENSVHVENLMPIRASELEKLEAKPAEPEPESLTTILPNQTSSETKHEDKKIEEISQLINDGQLGTLELLCRQKKIDDRKLSSYLNATFSVKNLSELKGSDFQRVCSWIESQEVRK